MAKESKEQEGATSATLAQLFDCTTRQVELLAERGIAVRIGRGRYALGPSIRNYVKHLREQAAARVGQDPAKDSVGANVKFKDSQTRLNELRIRREAGELIPVGRAKEVWERLTRGMRQMHLGVANKVAFRLPMLGREDIAAIEEICRDDLDGAALGLGFDLTFDDSVEADGSVLSH